MSWKIIVTLGCFGIVMGAASLFGLTQRIEPLLWLFIAFFSAYWIARNRTPRPFRHGLVAAVLMGVFNSTMQSVFFDMYLTNSPVAANGFYQLPGGIPVRVLVLFIGLAIGVTYGVVVGVFAVVATKLLKKRPK
jgi:hypothetical protein